MIQSELHIFFYVYLFAYTEFSQRSTKKRIDVT